MSLTWIDITSADGSVHFGLAEKLTNTEQKIQEKQRHEEMARLESSVLFYFDQSVAQAAKIERLESALRRFESEGVKSEKLSEMSNKLAETAASLAEHGKLVDRLRSALVAKEKVRFDLETKLRSVVSRGKVVVQLRSSAAWFADEVPDAAPSIPEPAAARSAPSGALSGPFLRSRSMVTRQLARSRSDLGEQIAPYPALEAPSKGFVFVMTYPRSGDLVLQKVLNSIPGYCIRGEVGGVLRPLSNAWAETASSGQGVGQEDLEMASLILGWEIADNFVANVLAPEPGSQVVGFRSNEIYGEIEAFWNVASFLFSSFPRSRIIFNTRNAERVSRSGPWARKPQDQVLQTLRRMDGFFDEFVKAHPDRSIRVSYDDYTTSEDSLNRIYDFLGEDVRPGLFDTTSDQG